MHNYEEEKSRVASFARRCGVVRTNREPVGEGEAWDRINDDVVRRLD